MKLRFWAALLIFISAYSPLSVIFIIQNYSVVNKVIVLNHPLFVLVYLAISIISCALLVMIVKTLQSSTPPIKIVNISRRSGELVNYSIPYMISFFVVDLGDTQVLLSFLFFMILMFWITYKTHNIFVNPILACLGYNLFDVTYVQNDKTYNAYIIHKGLALFPNDICRIAEISDKLYLATEINKEI
jgi:hypothetical protein